jgi:cob(I)alamin adenosyltransferase
MTSEAAAGTAPTDDPRPDGLRSAPSLVVVNTGDGKGKSSAAFGVMVRALARGWSVAVVQFIKSGDWKVGEEKLGRELGVDWHAFGDGFTWDSDDLAADRAHAAEGWAKAVEILDAGEHELVIFDELTYLSSFGWLDAAVIAEAIRQRPSHVNVVITGRDAAPELIEIADTVTEMREVKHAYKQGIRAKRGIDY